MLNFFWLGFLFLFFLVCQVFAADGKDNADINNVNIPISLISTYRMQDYDAVVTEDLKKIASFSEQAHRLTQASALFLGRPYELFPTGEGASGLFDKGPLYRTDVFDCLTYVTMVIALSVSHDLTSFKENIQRLNYQDGYINFLTRNHFVSTDYNIENQKQGYLEDITDTIVDEHGRPVSMHEMTSVDKPHWIKHLSPLRIHLFNFPGNDATWQLINRLHANASYLSIKQAEVSYIPMQALFNAAQEANLDLFKQIPNGALIEIVRKATPDTYATHLYISHLGFAVITPYGLQFREASSVEERVVDVPLIAYLRSYTTKDYPILGIHIERILGHCTEKTD